MKMESLTIHDLLVSYLKTHYAGKTVLVIYGGSDYSDQEMDSLYEELEFYYLRPNHPASIYDVFLIEITQPFPTLEKIKEIMEDHRKGSINLELYDDGQEIAY